MTAPTPTPAALRRAVRRAEAVIANYADGAGSEAANQGKRHTKLDKTQITVQVNRAIEAAARLRGPDLVVLNDPVGTGKTIVALTAARILLDGTLGASTSIRRVLIVTPNEEVAKVWRTRATWAGFTLKGPAPEIVIRTVRQVHDLGLEGLPRSRADLLVIVDEAHRGLHNKNSVAYVGLSRVAHGARLLLVTATPFQLTGSGLETMLEVDGNDTRGDNILKFSKAVATWLRRTHDGDTPGNSSTDLDRLRQDVRDALSLARADLDNVLMPAYPHKRMRRPRWMPLPAAPIPVELGPWAQTYHAARVLPELLHGGSAAHAVQNSDSYMRMLVSSTGAWHASQVYRSAEGRGEPLTSLLQALNEATGPEPGSHPKVALTSRTALESLRSGHHVLIFCVFLATKVDLAIAIDAELRRADMGHQVHVAEDLSDAQAALTAGFGRTPKKTNPPRVLIVSDKLSESVDLDGGKPVVIHHDLSWSPVRWEQRMGRVVRASTGFQNPPSVVVPVLQADVDIRMWETLQGRRSLTEHVVGERLRDMLDDALGGLDIDDVD